MTPMTYRDWDAVEALRGTNPGGKHADGWPDERPPKIHPEAWAVCVGSRRKHAQHEEAKANEKARLTRERDKREAAEREREERHRRLAAAAQREEAR